MSHCVISQAVYDVGNVHYSAGEHMNRPPTTRAEHLLISTYPLQSRRIIRAVSNKLISDWRSAHPVTITADTTAPAATKETPLIETISATVSVDKTSSKQSGDADVASAKASRDQCAAEPAGSDSKPVRRAGVGVAPGSFMGLMLSVKDKVTGAALPDTTVSA